MIIFENQIHLQVNSLEFRVTATQPRGTSSVDDVVLYAYPLPRDLGRILTPTTYKTHQISITTQLCQLDLTTSFGAYCS